MNARDPRGLVAAIDLYVKDWHEWIEQDEPGEDGPAPVIGIALMEAAALSLTSALDALDTRHRASGGDPKGIL